MQNWKKDKQKAIAYLQSRKEICSQQHVLHALMNHNHPSLEHLSLADFGCGGGWSTYHLHNYFGIKNFTLFDLSSFALELAIDNLNPLCLESLEFVHEDICNPVHLPAENFDVAISMMTLCCLDDQATFLQNILKSLKKGGVLYMSTLYNRWHPDIDLEILQKDKTRNGNYLYKVISRNTVQSIIGSMEHVYTFQEHDFNIDVELARPLDGGVGTYTIPTDKKNIEISGGALFQWSFLVFYRS